MSAAPSIARIVESETPLLAPADVFPDWTPQAVSAHPDCFAPRLYDRASGRLMIAVQSFLVRAAGLTILVDACVGNHKRRRRPEFDGAEWPWLARLAAAGARPDDVDVVLCTHLHVDHVGWNTRLENGRWVPTFANARYLFARAEYEFWRGAAGRAGLARTGDYVADSVLPVFAAGQAELVEPTAEIATGVTLEPTAGHTPGHVAVHLGAASRETAVLSGDLMHHPLQCALPRWSTNFCTDPALARATRLDFLGRYADSGVAVLPSHFPAPTAGLVERAGSESFRFRFDGSTIGQVQP